MVHIALSFHGTVRKHRSLCYMVCAQPSASLLCAVALYDTGCLHAGVCALFAHWTSPQHSPPFSPLPPDGVLPHPVPFPYTANMAALLLTMGFGIHIDQGDGEWVWPVFLAVVGFLLSLVEVKNVWLASVLAAVGQACQTRGCRAACLTCLLQGDQLSLLSRWPALGDLPGCNYTQSAVIRRWTYCCQPCP